MMSEPRIMPVGGQNFQMLREGGCVYVDKTPYIYQLISQSRVYFLSRPRRFGKSLLLSTLAAYFRGKKELFKGLYLEKTEEELAQQRGRKAWIEYPVLYLDLNGSNYKEPDSLSITLNNHLSAWEAVYGTAASEQDYSTRFWGIIRRAYEKTGHQVVVLVDEYDKPLLDTLDDSELNETYRNILKAFYSVIKSTDQYLRFAFLVGVTKFSKVSVFSGLNNLKDLSLRSDFAAICGITETELRENFAPELDILAAKLKQTREETLAILKHRYDGYLFAAKGENVYNPFSLLNVFDANVLADYWYSTGTPPFLVEYLKEAHYYVPNLEGNVELDGAGLETHRVDAHDAVPTLFQAGYLTIKSYDPEVFLYRLGYPNSEVRTGFLKNLLPSYTSISNANSGKCVADFYRDIRDGNVDAFMVRMQSLLVGIPYSTDALETVTWREQNYQIAVYYCVCLDGSICTNRSAECYRACRLCRAYEGCYLHFRVQTLEYGDIARGSRTNSN